MASEKCRVFRLLLYKNFLVRKRHWKIALFVEIALPLILFISIWGIRNLVAEIPSQVTTNVTHSKKSKENHIPGGKRHIYIVPDNQRIKNFMSDVQKCFHMKSYEKVSSFKSENDMIKAYKEIESKSSKDNIMGVVFKNESFDPFSAQLDYKIMTTSRLPASIYNHLDIVASFTVFEEGITGLQICLDESFIKLKGKMHKNNVNISIFTQKMPIPAHVKIGFQDTLIRLLFCIFALVAFMIILCVETSYASIEKFLGVNVLMAMNGVPNYLNLLSWLVTGVMFSILYNIPIVILLNLTSTETAFPFLYFGNAFIFWIVLTVHVVHLITFGMHVSAYFTRSLFMVTVLILFYVGTTAIQRYGFKESAYIIIPYMGIIFPNILLFRAFEVVNHFESIIEGVHWYNLFNIGQPAYGTQGSMGMIIIFSLLGGIFHFTMANYIYAINPGKYGIKKSPFYFLKYFKRTKQSFEYDKVDIFEFNDTSSETFESVAEGVYTPGIQIRNLKKTYNINFFSRLKVYALKGISVDFYQGQITALLGHNGAGKTTMMSILTGMINPSEGLVIINGKNVSEKSDEIMNDMGLCPQENMLFPHLSVTEQLTFFAMLKNKDKSKSIIKVDVKSLLHKLQLIDKQNYLPDQLSDGQKRRVCLGMAMIGDSSVLVLDEPTSGLDPESRRNVWNLLLKMRGEKTILISTHDMEEADILGDRIAIVHNGYLKSYGTSMYLKKLLGRGNVEITLSIESSCNYEKIYNYLHPQSEIFSLDDRKIVLSTPFTPELPDSLDKIESNKSTLGIRGMSVSLITLEQVFLKVTSDDANNINANEPFNNTTTKLKGQELFRHCAMALLSKKMAYTKKNVMTILTMLFMLTIPMLCISFILIDHDVTDKSPDPVTLSLNMFNNPINYYRTDNKTEKYGHSYRTIVEDLGGKAIQDMKTNNTLSTALLDIGAKNFVNYNYHVLVGAEFKTGAKYLRANSLHNSMAAAFTLPVSINLVTNSLLKSIASQEDKISMSLQQFPQEEDTYKYAFFGYMARIEGYLVPFILVSLLYPAVALLVIHPIRENLTNIKHLQRMSGASCLNYWGTMFLFDFTVLSAMMLLLVAGYVVMDAALGLKIFKTEEILIMVVLFLLFAVNVLPFIYCFSFWKKSTNAAIKLLSLLPVGLVSVEIIINLVSIILQNKNYAMNIIRPVQKGIFLLIPYISFYHGHVSFFTTAKLNINCQRMSKFFDMNFFNCMANDPICCAMKCNNGTCDNPLTYFNDFKNDIALESSLLSLCFTPILYFGILCILEHKLISILIARFFVSKPNKTFEILDERVEKEKYNVDYEISKIKNKRKEALLDNEKATNQFLVYELRKLYGGLIAVEDVSFSVEESECFGLLGVNGAGKSTTFKMMTGEEIPVHGKIYLGSKDLRKNREYLSEIGYCPQNDAIIKCLNSYEHLNLFARLHGIPENQVNVEVNKWINRLNLNSCALQPSGTYSGGNKRRLNVAIAFIGKPNLVLLDEPTTGVDPAARRLLWSVIQSYQSSGQSIILTTHSMEECEVLCTRLGIMVDGRLLCIGPSQELKQRFGAGFNIQLKLNPENSKDKFDLIKQDMAKAFECNILDENSGYIMYHVTSVETTWRQMYNVTSDLKSKYDCIEDFSVLSSTLEQLFLSFAKVADKSRQTTM